MMNDEFTPITENQKAWLIKNGYNGDTPIEELTKAEAFNIISQMTGQNLAGQQQPQQQRPVQKPVRQQAPEPQPQKNELTTFESNISDNIINQITVLETEQGLVLPKDYNPTNALKMAYLKLAESNLLNTDQNALAQSLLNMVIQGLNPAKNQCYFINYGGKVNLMRSYFGDVTAALNTGLVKGVYANVIYEGDDVEVTYDNLGYMHVDHKTSWENFGGDIVGAYAFADLTDGRRLYDIMPIDRIKKSWAMSKNNTNNKLQQNFTDDACKRTVIRHLVKSIFNTTSDQNVMVDSFNNTTSDEYADNEEFKESTVADVKKKQKDQNASKIIDANIDDENWTDAE